jgi:hypothetical protein
MAAHAAPRVVAAMLLKRCGREMIVIAHTCVCSSGAQRERHALHRSITKGARTELDVLLLVVSRQLQRRHIAAITDTG